MRNKMDMEITYRATVIKKYLSGLPLIGSHLSVIVLVNVISGVIQILTNVSNVYPSEHIIKDTHMLIHLVVYIQS